VYVDDLVITGGDVVEIKHFKQDMKSTFQMSDLGLLSYYLGLEVKPGNDGIAISQGAFARKIVEKAGLKNCNPSAMPMETRPGLSKSSTCSAIDSTAYRCIVGALRCLVNTRPDIEIVVGFISHFMEKPTTEHLLAVKRVPRYVAGTADYGCYYQRRKKSVGLTGYSDNDHAGDVDTHKSTMWVLFFLGDSLITWQSQKHKIVALSSYETEYIAAVVASY
jgi:hypothetical protein